MAVLPIPTPAALNDSQGQSTPAAFRFLQSLEVAARAAVTSLAGITGRTERDILTIAFPTNQAYAIEISAPFGYTIKNVKTQSTSGTCTLNITINAVALGGGTNAVSNSVVAVTHTSANIVAITNILTANITANAACVGLVAVIEYVRA